MTSAQALQYARTNYPCVNWTGAAACFTPLTDQTIVPAWSVTGHTDIQEPVIIIVK